tara:strand:- start:7 stop:390 length:384 start_codon:yes stop_codon:yes gene_type:complete
MTKLSELHREELEPINREIARVQKLLRDAKKEYIWGSMADFYEHKYLNDLKKLMARKAEIKARKVQTEANYSITFTITGNSEEENVQKINALEEILRVASSKFDNSIDVITFEETSQYQIAIRSELE